MFNIDEAHYIVSCWSYGSLHHHFATKSRTGAVLHAQEFVQSAEAARQSREADIEFGCNAEGYTEVAFEVAK